MFIINDVLRLSEVAEPLEDFEAAELLRLERVERKAMPVAFVATALMAIIGMTTNRLWLLQPSLLGALGFFVSYLLVRRGSVRAAALGFVVTAVGLVTNAGVGGFGLRDPAVLAYPVIIIFAGLTLKVRSYLIALAFVATSVLFVAFNGFYRWIPASNTTASPVIDAVTASVILSATAYSVWLLSASTTGCLSSAHHEIQRRREAERELMILNSRDALTGVYSRRFFDAEIARLEPARHYPVSVIVADIDGLKTINDQFGHAAGDGALKQAGSILSSVVRVEDVLARIGGDEFAILLPDTDESTAAEAVERIEQRVANQQVAENGLRVSMSLGVATTITGDLSHALAQADACMYRRRSEKRANVAQALQKESHDRK